MHRGNVLVRRTKAKVAYFRLDGKDYWVPTYGVQATVVDYTLSRVRQGQHQSCVVLRSGAHLKRLGLTVLVFGALT